MSRVLLFFWRKMLLLLIINTVMMVPLVSFIFQTPSSSHHGVVVVVDAWILPFSTTTSRRTRSTSSSSHGRSWNLLLLSSQLTSNNNNNKPFVLSSSLSDDTTTTVIPIVPPPSTETTLASTTTTTSTKHTTTNNNTIIIPINPLLDTIQASKTVEIFSKVKQMQAEGQVVTSLCVGEPDYPPPRAVLQAVQHAIQTTDNHQNVNDEEDDSNSRIAAATKYTAVTGTYELRQAISHDLHRRKHVYYHPLHQIVVANGAKQCVFQALWAICGRNDQVLIPAPYWPSYPEMVKLMGAIPVILPTLPQDGYLLTPHTLRQALEEHTTTTTNNNSKVKALILCNPSNPTGGVHNQQRLEELANVLLDYPQVVVVADEIYERLVYPPYKEDDNNNRDHAIIDTTTSSSTTTTTAIDCPCFASIAQGQLWHRTIIINGLSKSHAMTGFRLGYVAGPTHIISAITTLQSQFTSCASSLSQLAGVAAFQSVSDDELQSLVHLLQAKRDYVVSQLRNTMPHPKHVQLLVVPPQGAFYVLPDISYYCQDDKDDETLCMELLEQEQLAVVPGSSFGAPGTIRLSYATSWKELELAMTKLRNFLSRKHHEQQLLLLQQQQE